MPPTLYGLIVVTVSRGPAYYADGVTDGSRQTVLTSATAGFTAADAGDTWPSAAPANIP